MSWLLSTFHAENWTYTHCLCTSAEEDCSLKHKMMNFDEDRESQDELIHEGKKSSGLKLTYLLQCIPDLLSIGFVETTNAFWFKT